MHLMGVSNSEVGYTPAMPRREDHEVHKGHVVALEKKKNILVTRKAERALWCNKHKIRKRKKTSSFNHADHSFDELKLIINFRLLWLHSGHVVVCTAILPLP